MISEYEILSVILQTMEKKTTYTFDEATQGALEYFGGDALAARVWASKYAMKDSYGNIYEQFMAISMSSRPTTCITALLAR